MSFDQIVTEDPTKKTVRRLPPIGFWSYGRLDDDASRGALTNLRLALRAELEQQLGEPIELFQDVGAIPYGADWEQEILHAISKSHFFIPIITPRFLQSDWCNREMRFFLERQEEIYRENPEMERRNRIFPIRYIDVKNVDAIDEVAARKVMATQLLPFEGLRLKDPNSEAVRTAVADFAEDICAVLRLPIDGPATARGTSRPASSPLARPSSSPDSDDRPSRPDRAGWGRTVALAALATTLVIGAVYWWNGRVEKRADAVAPATPPKPAASAVPTAPPKPDMRWLLAKWGIGGDCASPMIFTASEPGQFVVTFNGRSEANVAKIESATVVVTDHARFTRTGATVQVDDRDVRYELVPCA